VPEINLAGVLSARAKRYGDKPAVVFEGRRYTFRECDAFVGRYAALLQRLGIKKGDRVALQLPKGMEFVFFHLAALSLAAVTLPLNTAYPPEEVAYGHYWFMQKRIMAIPLAQQRTISRKFIGSKNKISFIKLLVLSKGNNHFMDLSAILKEISCFNGCNS
jgi:non-ribosomal peptide synthetase component E (peptide arylation enzyme)